MTRSEELIDECLEIIDGFYGGVLIKPENFHIAGEIHMLAKNIRDLKAKSENNESRSDAVWQPIETAPKDGKRLLLLDEDGTAVEAFWDTTWTQMHPEGHGAWNYNYSRTLDNQLGMQTIEVDAPTHWMPLPEPPTEANS